MTPIKWMLVALAACSVLFIAWLLLGSYLWIQHQQAIAVICFLLAFFSVLGQFVMLALTLREHQRRRQSNHSSQQSAP